MAKRVDEQGALDRLTQAASVASRLGKERVGVNVADLAFILDDRAKAYRLATRYATEAANLERAAAGKRVATPPAQEGER